MLSIVEQRMRAENTARAERLAKETALDDAALAAVEEPYPSLAAAVRLAAKGLAALGYGREDTLVADIHRRIAHLYR
mgnify:CR=1 FL=1